MTYTYDAVNRLATRLISAGCRARSTSLESPMVRPATAPTSAPSKVSLFADSAVQPTLACRMTRVREARSSGTRTLRQLAAVESRVTILRDLSSQWERRWSPAPARLVRLAALKSQSNTRRRPRSRPMIEDRLWPANQNYIKVIDLVASPATIVIPALIGDVRTNRL